MREPERSFDPDDYAPAEARDEREFDPYRDGYLGEENDCAEA